MAITEGEPIAPRALVARIKTLLLHPRVEWDRIDGEPATIPGIYRGYVCIVTAVGPLAMLIGSVVFQHASIASALMFSAALYLLWLVMTYVMALVIAWAAPRFGGQGDKVQAFKVAGYALTASALSGVFAIWPPLSFFSIVGFYSFYLLWVGLPKLTKTPDDKAMALYAVVLAVTLGLGLLVGLILMRFV